MPPISSDKQPQFHTVFPRPIEGIVHGYSTRGGGVSRSPYGSLNLGDHVGDDAGDVARNRGVLSEALNLPSERWVTAEQVHSGEVAHVSGGDAGKKIPSVDALVTDTPNLPLALMYADCASVFLVDPERRAIGLAHAGWRGTAANIALHIVRAMESTFGSRPEELKAAVGPHIGPCCYTVGEEVARALGQWEGAISTSEAAYQADLGAANRAQLLEAGLSPDHISSNALCTACNTHLFFSYRKEGTTGRMAAVMMIEGERR